VECALGNSLHIGRAGRYFFNRRVVGRINEYEVRQPDIERRSHGGLDLIRDRSEQALKCLRVDWNLVMVRKISCFPELAHFAPSLARCP
jgi:hypothetical protein